MSEFNAEIWDEGLLKVTTKPGSKGPSTGNTTTTTGTTTSNNTTGNTVKASTNLTPTPSSHYYYHSGAPSSSSSMTTLNSVQLDNPSSNSHSAAASTTTPSVTFSTQMTPSSESVTPPTDSLHHGNHLNTTPTLMTVAVPQAEREPMVSHSAAVTESASSLPQLPPVQRRRSRFGNASGNIVSLEGASASSSSSRKTNLWYRIFHPNEAIDSAANQYHYNNAHPSNGGGAVWAKSRRSYNPSDCGSGSDVDSSDDGGSSASSSSRHHHSSHHVRGSSGGSSSRRSVSSRGSAGGSDDEGSTGSGDVFDLGDLKHQAASIFEPLFRGASRRGSVKQQQQQQKTVSTKSHVPISDRPSLFPATDRQGSSSSGAASIYHRPSSAASAAATSSRRKASFDTLSSDDGGHSSDGREDSDLEGSTDFDSDLEHHHSSDKNAFPAMKRSVSKSLFKDFLNWRTPSAANLHKMTAFGSDDGMSTKSEHGGATGVLAGGSVGDASHRSDHPAQRRPSHAPHQSSLFKDLRTPHSSSVTKFNSAKAVEFSSHGSSSSCSIASLGGVVPGETAATGSSANRRGESPVPEQSAPRKPTSASSTSSASSSETMCLSQKYGKVADILGKGSNATVRLCCPVNSTQKYAVKEFRPRRKEETQKEYVKKLVAEFCISSSLEHENIVKTVDLIQDERKRWCVVMEFLPGGDLYTRIRAGKLTDSPDEINCYMMQLIRGVAYLHSTGVAHRDLKPENLLLDSTARHLKITDFGVSEVFRTPFESTCHKAHGLCGSGPYIAPEEFITKEYDSQLVDIWSIGVIYYVMASNSVPWRIANANDPHYKQYFDRRRSSGDQCTSCCMDRFAPWPRTFLHHVLQPDPVKRWSMADILKCEWIKFLQCDCCSLSASAACGGSASVCKHAHVV